MYQRINSNQTALTQWFGSVHFRRYAHDFRLNVIGNIQYTDQRHNFIFFAIYAFTVNIVVALLSFNPFFVWRCTSWSHVIQLNSQQPLTAGILAHIYILVSSGIKTLFSAPILILRDIFAFTFCWTRILFWRLYKNLVQTRV